MTTRPARPSRPSGPAACLACLIALGIAAPVVSSAAATPAAAPATAAVTEAEVIALMRGIENAARARNVARLADALADDCRLELQTRIGGQERTTSLTKAEYVELLGSGYASMRDLDAYDYEIRDLRVTLDDRGAGATVVARVVETSVFAGRQLVTESVETSRIERRDGRLQVVAVSAVTQAAQPT